MKFISRLYAFINPILPDKIFIQIQYYHVYKQFLNFKDPKTYAEKLAWLKLYNKNFQHSKYVDKHEVKEFVKRKIGQEFLIPEIGLYCNVADIIWEELPSEFVIKCTHDSGSTLICTKKNGFNIVEAERFLNRKLQKNLYYYSREYPYKNIMPRIICEKLLLENESLPMDYKFMCFHGKVKMIVLDKDRFTNHKRNFYDCDWNRLDITSDHEQTEEVIPKPDKLQQMIILAEVLSKEFIHVRVDFYYCLGRIYFGELTFFPWGGLIKFAPNEINYLLGSYIKLPQ